MGERGSYCHVRRKGLEVESVVNPLLHEGLHNLSPSLASLRFKPLTFAIVALIDCLNDWVNIFITSLLLSIQSVDEGLPMSTLFV